MPDVLPNATLPIYPSLGQAKVKVGMHQGSALSPLLLVIVMEALSTEFRVTLPWKLLYADDLVVTADTEDDLINRLNEWKDFVENRGMRVTHTHNHFMALWNLSGKTRVSRYQKKHSPTHTHRGHQSSLTAFSI